MQILILKRHSFLLGFLLMCLLGACSDDKLIGFNRPCPPGTTSVDGLCLPANGAVRGRFCDVEQGAWRVGVEVGLQANGESHRAQTNGEGWFFLGDIPPGSYTLLASLDNYTIERSVVVVSNEVTRVGDEECDGVHGSIEGRVCDSVRGQWVANAQVVLNGSIQTLSDESGRYRFSNVEPGEYELFIQWEDNSTSIECSVEARVRTELGPDTCEPLLGSIRGRICVGERYWLSQARVAVEIEEGVFREGITDSDGYFQIDGIPQGDYLFDVSRGSYSTSFTASIIAGEQTVLEEPVCIPPDTKMAVITGDYDSIEVVLENLGFAVRRNFSAAGQEPTLIHSEGNIDVINGADSDLWFHGFVSDPLWMDEYDILFFNCGLDDSQIRTPSSSLSTMIDNLQGYLGKGRSIYASDWASEVLRIAFPGRINFQGDESTFGAARVGAANANAAATITDNGLLNTIGSENITVNFNYNIWASLEPVASQPADLHVMVKSDISLESGVAVSDSPVVVRFEHGEGRVVFTSPHHESQITTDLADLLNYMVFEL